MLFIHCINHDEKEWHVGEVVPMADVDIGRDVVFIQADGDELEYIRSKFGVAALCPAAWPRVAGAGNPTSVKWFGDTAKFILGNL